MQRYDFSPLFRSTVGFDRLARLADAAGRVDESVNYPPYNIEKLDETAYRITMAVAGFTSDTVEITQNESVLTIVGAAQEEPATVQYLHRGIARRGFERRFQLADHIKVKNASLLNGLLSIDLVREVPEALKPRRIAIETGKPVGLTVDQTGERVSQAA